MSRARWSRPPKRKPIDWLAFVNLADGTPAVVEALNNSGGICKGQQYKCWDFEGEYYAIWNQAGNGVWCHKSNLKLIAKGSVEKLQSK